MWHEYFHLKKYGQKSHRKYQRCEVTKKNPLWVMFSVIFWFRKKSQTNETELKLLSKQKTKQKWNYNCRWRCFAFRWKTKQRQWKWFLIYASRRLFNCKNNKEEPTIMSYVFSHCFELKKGQTNETKSKLLSKQKWIYKCRGRCFTFRWKTKRRR